MDVSKLDIDDKDLLDSQRKKLDSLGQERDSLSLQVSNLEIHTLNSLIDNFPWQTKTIPTWINHELYSSNKKSFMPDLT